MLSRSAGWQPAVSPTGSRPGVRSGWRLRITNPRYSRQTVCATLVAALAALSSWRLKNQTGIHHPFAQSILPVYGWAYEVEEVRIFIGRNVVAVLRNRIGHAVHVLGHDRRRPGNHQPGPRSASRLTPMWCRSNSICCMRPIISRPARPLAAVPWRIKSLPAPW